MQVIRPYIHILIQDVQDGAHEFAFLTSSQVIADAADPQTTL